MYFWYKGDADTGTVQVESNTKAYKNFYETHVKDKLIVNFVKVKGHSGDEYNERADKLAKASLK